MEWKKCCRIYSVFSNGTFALLDLLTGYLGKDLVINETIYDSFTWVVLGCFGIAGAEKFAKK